MRDFLQNFISVEWQSYEYDTPFQIWLATQKQHRKMRQVIPTLENNNFQSAYNVSTVNINITFKTTLN